ncbi:Bax inhibitor-1/YccA family membrane protein [Micromonosporaceae bacterium DT55]|uniref:Bax inhibitor-1/YccA family protein n=1 Tax=Melissospora conviva TaxID=3388432 RepID=UPI003C24C333
MAQANPVLTRLDDTARVQRQVLGTGPAEAMTVDDVVLRTVLLLLLTGVVGAFSWLFVPQQAWIGGSLFGAGLAAVLLALLISIRGATNPVVIAVYAVLQGVLLGVTSRAFELVYPGIVIQAVTGTFAVFFGMAVLYRARVIRATPRLARFVAGTLIGLLVLGAANLLAHLFGGPQLLEVYSLTGRVGWLPYVFSGIAVMAGALTFILDFDAVERGVAEGLPRRYAWYCAFGILVGLIYLYWQILRLLSYLRR